jgi:excisionase family DNA binding protein
MAEEVIEIMTTKEVADYLRLHEVTVCKYATENKIPHVRIGRVFRFRKDWIDEWLQGKSDATEISS